MHTRRPLLTIVGLIIGVASFLISIAQMLSKTPDTILIRAMILGEVIALLALLLVVLKLDLFDPPDNR